MDNSSRLQTQSEILDSVSEHLINNPRAAKTLGIEGEELNSLAQLLGLILGQIVLVNSEIKNTSEGIFSKHQDVLESSIRDITETARRNFEPGGVAATLLYSRGVHAILAHRVAHQLWLDGNHNLALALKSTLGRALSTDIHPAARFGAGIWLDHGLGFVVGETAVIEDDVSIWHNVTLGSTLTDDGETRHPIIKRGAVIGAGAIVLGGISIGENAAVAAGAIVIDNVPASRVIASAKARLKGSAKVSFINENKEQ